MHHCRPVLLRLPRLGRVVNDLESNRVDSWSSLTSPALSPSSPCVPIRLPSHRSTLFFLNVHVCAPPPRSPCHRLFPSAARRPLVRRAEEGVAVQEERSQNMTRQESGSGSGSTYRRLVRRADDSLGPIIRRTFTNREKRNRAARSALLRCLTPREGGRPEEGRRN